MKRLAALYRWMRRLLLLSAVIVMTLLIGRVVQSQAGLPLELWHTFVPVEPDAAAIDQTPLRATHTVMPGEGPASTSLQLVAKKDVDVGAKPRHDGVGYAHREPVLQVVPRRMRADA